MFLYGSPYRVDGRRSASLGIVPNSLWRANGPQIVRLTGECGRDFGPQCYLGPVVVCLRPVFPRHHGAPGEALVFTPRPSVSRETFNVDAKLVLLGPYPTAYSIQPVLPARFHVKHQRRGIPCPMADNSDARQQPARRLLQVLTFCH